MLGAVAIKQSICDIASDRTGVILSYVASFLSSMAAQFALIDVAANCGALKFSMSFFTSTERLLAAH
jgi:hypothetical protein